MCGQAPELSRLAQPSSQKTTGGICLHPAAPGPAPPLSASQTCKRGCSLDPSGQYRSQVRPLGPREPLHRPEPAPTPPAPQAAAETEGGGCLPRGQGRGQAKCHQLSPRPRWALQLPTCFPGSLLRVALGAQGRDSVPGGSGPGRCSPAILLTSSRTRDSDPSRGRRRLPCRGQHLRPRGVRGGVGEGCPSLKHPLLHQSRSQQGPPERVSKIISLQELKCWPSGLIEVYFRCRAVVQSLSFEIDPNDAL